MPAESREGAGTPWRLLAGAVPTILFTSLVIGTASWLARVSTARTGWEALVWWLQAWAEFAVWASIVTVPAVVLLGWPLDRLAAPLPPLRVALRFALLGLAVGAVAGFAILAALDAGWLGAAVVAPLGAAGAFVGRLLGDPLARRRGVLVALVAVTLALVAVGVASP